MRFDPIVVRGRLADNYTIDVMGEKFTIKAKPGKRIGFTLSAEFTDVDDMNQFMGTMRQWSLNALQVKTPPRANKVVVRTMDVGIATAILGEMAYQSESGFIHYIPERGDHEDR